MPRTSTLPLPAPPVGAPAAEAGVPPPPLAQLRPVLPDERPQIETTRPGGYGAPGPEGPGATGPRLAERALSPPVQTPPAGAAYPAEPPPGSPGAMTPPPGTYPPGPLAQGGYPSADGLAMPRRDSDLARPPLPPGTRPRSRLPLVLGGVVAAAALAVGGWFVYGAISDGDGGGGGGGGTGTGTGPVAGGGGGTGSSVAASRDAGTAIAIAPDAPPDTPPKPAELSIVSIPAGARVFLDGADAGTTPLKLPGSADRHTVALLLAGHELYVAEVDGHGTFSIPLKEVVPAGDFAGIKVLRCKDKERYYVYVDGKPSGQTCPTERINTTLGRHTVEVYDIVTETRRKWEIDIKDGRLSYRIRIDPP